MKRERRVYGAVMLLAVVFGMGPAVGDIGSCGQAVDRLDERTFFEIKSNIDCSQCKDCSLGTRACDGACNGLGQQALPATCEPLVHDGEVCLRALLHASCDDYASFMSDTAPTAPSECQFCPVR